MNEGPVRFRATLVSLVVLLAFGGLGVRLYALQVRGHSHAAARKKGQSGAHVRVDRPRGAIRDAHGEILAVSVPVTSVWADPSKAGSEEARALAGALGSNPEEMERRLARDHRRFVWLKRGVSEEESTRVEKLEQAWRTAHPREEPPFGRRAEYDRVYPFGTIGAHVVGMTGEQSPVESAWIDPSNAGRDLARPLSEALGLPRSAVERHFERRGVRFVWLKRGLSGSESARVRELDLEWRERHPNRAAPFGIRLEFDSRYSEERLAALLNGQPGRPTEDRRPGEHGRTGVERLFDCLLDGGTVEQPVALDGRRRILGGVPPARSDATVTLTILVELQRIVEEELATVAREHRPKWATAVVMDPVTGAVLALGNWPAYDPNSPGEHAAFLNSALGAPYEPGSQLKAFFAAAALEERLLRPETVFDCENGLWQYGSRRLSDHHPFARLSLEDVIAKSSNIGAAKLGVLILGPDRMSRWLREFGFGTRTGIDLPGEEAGRVPRLPWSVSQTGISITIGQEIPVTEIQMAAAMCVLANGGSLPRPFVVRRIVLEDGTLVYQSAPGLRRVLSENTCRTMRGILKRVVDSGTGKEAKIEGLPTAGKTGTTQLINRRGVVTGHISSFVGFAPAEIPRFVVAVAIGEPSGGTYYGGKVAAPVFRRIVERGYPLVR